MKIGFFLDWLYLLRERELRDWEVQAALHGAKIGGRGGLNGRAERTSRAAEALGGLAAAGAFSVERVKVSAEELERRKRDTR